jgi:hypothetical protein
MVEKGKTTTQADYLYVKYELGKWRNAVKSRACCVCLNVLNLERSWDMTVEHFCGVGNKPVYKKRKKELKQKIIFLPLATEILFFFFDYTSNYEDVM